MKARWFLEASGVALLLSFPYFAQLLFPGDLSLYHHHRQLAHVLCGAILAMAEIFLLALGAISYFHYRFAPKPRAIAAAAIATLIILYATRNALSLAASHHSQFLSLTTHIFAMWQLRLVLIAAVAVLAWWKPSRTRRFVGGTRLALAGFSFCLLWIIPQLLYFSFGLKPTHRSQPPLQRTSPKQIVWILFDELSYKLVFDQPPPGMEFPNFSKLRFESFSFADMQAPGFYTDRVVPSVIAGKQIDEIRSNTDRKLLYLSETEHRWLPYDQNQTLFGLAKANGWNTGVDGWYNPYCRIFSSVLDACSWEPPEIFRLPLESVGASEDRSTFANAQILVRAFLTGQFPGDAELIAPRPVAYSNLMKHAQTLIEDEKIDFIFIHLSVPHPPGFFDRKTHKLCICGNYLDNLVLADDSLGQLREEIARSPQAAQTTLIVSSDHSWRVPLWKKYDFWTPEEERISQGQFDTRPVLLIHFPGQTSAMNISDPESELVEHDIIAGMLQHKLQSPNDLTSFLRTQPLQASR